MTSRQKQAEQTKKKIFNSAVYLMQKQGIDDTTIEQICKRAKVSVGSFYNYYKSKDDVIVSAFESADIYFKNIVVEKIQGLSFDNQIISFFKYYAKYNNEQGLPFVKNLYNNSEHKLFVARDRFMHKLLREILAEGIKAGSIVPNITAAEIEDFLFIVARGVVNDWCLHDGDYDLIKKMTDYIQHILKSFK